MKYLLLFSYALVPKSKYRPKEVEFNESLDENYSLTGLSIIETYSGNIIYKEGEIDKVLVLGCHTFGQNTPADSELMAKYLEKLGVTNKNIIVSTEGINTVYQVSKAKELLSDFGDATEIIGVALECHVRRTGKLLSAYGINAKMLSVEEILKRDASIVPDDILGILHDFKNSQIESQLLFEAIILELIQMVDPKGELQKLLTHLRGIRYFDVDIPNTIAKNQK